MDWHNVSKPNSQSFTNINPLGKEQYDQSNVFYDDDVFYDGIDPFLWNDVSRPLTGLYMGFGALTYSGGTPNDYSWIKISKPTEPTE